MSFAKGISNLVRDKRKDISDAEIAGYYLGITKVPIRICSPLRQDTKPSFGIYTRDGEHIYYTDFAHTKRIENAYEHLDRMKQGSNYRFTFKNEDGNYVFVSSEPIK